jgi:protease I
VSLSGKKIAFLVADEGIEQVELTQPWEAVTKDGGQPVLIVGSDSKTVQAFNHLDKADTFDADLPVSRAGVEDYDGLVLPGGVANPDAVAFVKAFLDSGKPVAAICHAPWTLVEADVVRGRTVTSWPSLQTDLRNAGAQWVDQEVVVDTNGPGPLVTSRNPGDIPAFNKALSDAF